MLKFSEYSKIPGIKINESVIKYGNNMKVNIVYNVPVQLLNEYVEKIKGAGKNPAAFFTTEQIAEEMVKYTLDQFMKLENIPIEIIVGEQPEVEEKKEEAPEEKKEEAPEEKSKEESKAPEIEISEGDKEEVKVKEVDSAKDEEEEENDYMNKYTSMGQEVSTGFKINPITQKQVLANKIGLTNNFKK
jgi:hypothetical protein